MALLSAGDRSEGSNNSCESINSATRDGISVNRHTVLNCGQRAERRTNRILNVGAQRYIAVSYYLPSDYPLRGSGNILSQVYSFPTLSSSYKPCGGGGHKMSFGADGRFYYDINPASSSSCTRLYFSDANLDNFSELKGNWLHFLYDIKLATSGGRVVIYLMKGNSGTYTKVVDFQGRTWWDNEDDAYFKYGMYKGDPGWGNDGDVCVVDTRNIRASDASLQEAMLVQGTIGGGSTTPPPPPPPAPADNTYINVGSSSSVTTGGKTYVSDAAFRTGGSTRSTTVYSNPVYNTYVIGNQSYSIPVVSGNTYNVKLLMSEVFHQTANSRKFDIAINSNLVEDDLDLYAVSGYRQLHSETYQITATSGTLNLQLTTVVDNAILMGIEVEKTSGTVTPPPPTGSKIVTRINAGGSSVGRFSSDAYSNGGFTYTQTQSKTAPSGYSSEVAIYNTERNGSVGFSYAIPATAGQAYTVRLHFCELRDNTRVMNVDVQGNRVLSNFDVRVAAGGKNIGIFRDFAVTPSDGTIDIEFTAVTDRAQVCAIEAF